MRRQHLMVQVVVVGMTFRVGDPPGLYALGMTMCKMCEPIRSAVQGELMAGELMCPDVPPCGLPQAVQIHG